MVCDACSPALSDNPFDHQNSLLKDGHIQLSVFRCVSVYVRAQAAGFPAGFVDEHVEHEIKYRDKPVSLKGQFTENTKACFDRSMTLHGVKRVKSVESDVTKFDFSSIAPIAFCLLDVDLYKPINDV